MISFYEFINKNELEEIRRIRMYTKKQNAIDENGPFELITFDVEEACA